MSFTYETLTPDAVEAIAETATAPASPAVDYAALLPAWEADHAAHAALLAAAEEAEDLDAAALHSEALATLEAAILDGRAALAAE